MFVEFVTTKKENFIANLDDVKFFFEKKKNTLIVFSDGLEIEIDMQYCAVKKILSANSLLKILPPNFIDF